MKIKLKEIIDSIEEIQQVSQLKFPAKKAFELATLLEDLNSHCRLYEEIKNQKILDNSTDKKTVDQDKIEGFIKEINELLSKEIEVMDFHLEKSDFDGQNISAAQIMRLKWLIK